LYALGLVSSSVATRSARVIEPLIAVGTAAGLIDAADVPAAAVDGVVRLVLIDPGAEAGRTELEVMEKKNPRLGGSILCQGPLLERGNLGGFTCSRRSSVKEAIS
jgi:hypothetical protein